MQLGKIRRAVGIVKHDSKGGQHCGCENETEDSQLEGKKKVDKMKTF